MVPVPRVGACVWCSPNFWCVRAGADGPNGAATVPAPAAAPVAKEAGLSDAEFESRLGMGRDAFYALPKWKQVSKKKAAGLW